MEEFATLFESDSSFEEEVTFVKNGQTLQKAATQTSITDDCESSPPPYKKTKSEVHSILDFFV